MGQDTEAAIISTGSLSGEPGTQPEVVEKHDEQPPSDSTPEDEVKPVPVVDKLPAAVWIVAIAGAAERFAYYSLAAPLQNYIQNQRGGAIPGALGLGQQTATNLNNMFLLIQFVTPIPFAILSDARLGRLKTLFISLGIYQVGSLVLLLTSIPRALDAGAGLPGLITAMILIAVGIAGVKATLPPLLVDQYQNSGRPLKSKNGTLVVADRQLTVQFITNMFFWLTNVAALSSVPSTLIETHVDFWASNLLGFVSLLIASGVIFAYRRRFVDLDAHGSVLPLAFKALWCAVRNRFSLAAASPETQREVHGVIVPWTDTVLQDLGRTLVVSRILLCSAPFYLAYIQVTNNLISQAGQMRLDGIPNDTMQAWNPVACILLGPVVQHGLFPLLRRLRVPFGPVVRISVACTVMGAAMAYAAILQHIIYSQGPCFDYPGACEAATSSSPDGTTLAGNDLSVWKQLPVWFVLAVGEILGFATISEIAYEQAPASMKSLVQAITQLTAGLAAVLGIALSPVMRDPLLVILYSVIAGLTIAAALPFWLFFRAADRRARP
ncbi:oligopeptide transporter [Plectosphaerella plurivora]|uniref:Oligopeptide transporter n=1 Tax=Plectosphaerella plurivora TaxID=936078 RepID=A0A9P8VAN4_9PEZI|nr:oligopeptide transporter [Plectosphaerella plurivora]